MGHGVDCQPCWRIAKRSGEFCQRVSESPVPIGHASGEWCALDRVGAWPRRRSPTLNSTGTNFSPILVATRAARELRIRARSSGSAARTVGQQRPPECPHRPRSSARQLGCQSRLVSWQATHGNCSRLCSIRGMSLRARISGSAATCSFALVRLERSGSSFAAPFAKFWGRSCRESPHSPLC